MGEERELTIHRKFLIINEENRANHDYIDRQMRMIVL